MPKAWTLRLAELNTDVLRPAVATPVASQRRATLHRRLDLPTQPTCIASDLTVRQVAVTWPACAAVLASYPAARLDGRWTLQELGAFSRDHGENEQRFVERLGAAAGVPAAHRPAVPAKPSPIWLIFLACAVGLTAGAGWGVYLLLRISYGARYSSVSAGAVHVHGLAQLWGWMALFVFAVGGHLLRQSTRHPSPPWLERVAAAAIVAALLAFFAGLLPPASALAPVLRAVASGPLALAALLFGVSVGWSLLGRRQRPQVWHGFLLCAVGWLWTWAGADLALRVRHASAPILPDSARDMLILLPVLGFATNAIYGFGIRLLPGLLNIGRLRPKLFVISLITHNLGLVLMLLGGRRLSYVGAILMLLAAVSHWVGLDALRSKPSRPIYGVDPRGNILVRLAWFWLICGLGMICVQQWLGTAPHAFAGAWRHALTVGFVTTMILGVGQRILPVFMKQTLASQGLMIAAAWLIAVGNAGRVGLELATITERPWTFRLMGLTGLLELSALILFVANLMMTARNRQIVFQAGESITPNTRVREAVNVHPSLPQRLDALGINMLNAAPFIAPSMTFGALALASGWEPEELLARLSSTAPDIHLSPVTGGNHAV